MKGDDDALFPAKAEGNDDAASDANGQMIRNRIGKGLL